MSGSTSQQQQQSTTVSDSYNSYVTNYTYDTAVNTNVTLTGGVPEGASGIVSNALGSASSALNSAAQSAGLAPEKMPYYLGGAALFLVLIVVVLNRR